MRCPAEQAHVITRALDRLPDHVAAEVRALAEERLVAEAASFGPKELRVMGRRILDVVAPELGEEQERKALEAEEAAAAGEDLADRPAARKRPDRVARGPARRGLGPAGDLPGGLHLTQAARRGPPTTLMTGVPTR